MDTLATIDTEYNKEAKEEKTIVIRKRGCSTPESVNETHRLALEWIDLFNHNPLLPPNLPTRLSIGINLFQKLLWEMAQWNLEKKIKAFY